MQIQLQSQQEDLDAKAEEMSSLRSQLSEKAQVSNIGLYDINMPVLYWAMTKMLV